MNERVPIRRFLSSCSNEAHKDYDPETRTWGYCESCEYSFELHKWKDAYESTKKELETFQRESAWWMKKTWDTQKILEWFIDHYTPDPEMDAPDEVLDAVEARWRAKRGPSREAVYPSGRYHGD